MLSEFLKKNDKMSVDRLTAAEQILEGNNINITDCHNYDENDII